ncbi:insulinase family protein [Candidatus Protochlamydia sp. W-9]
MYSVEWRQSNAYTACDHTFYLFSMKHHAFPEALDRFSSFFKHLYLIPLE